MKSVKLLVGMAALALAAVVWMSLPVTAQGFKWWQSEKYKKELGLTADQTRRVEEVFQKALPTLKVQKTALDEAEAKFERLVERGDDNAVMEQVNLVEAARADLNKTRTMMLLGMRKLLTKEQWAKFNKMHQAAANAAPKPADGAK